MINFIKNLIYFLCIILIFIYWISREQYIILYYEGKIPLKNLKLHLGGEIDKIYPIPILFPNKLIKFYIPQVESYITLDSEDPDHDNATLCNFGYYSAMDTIDYKKLYKRVFFVSVYTKTNKPILLSWMVDKRKNIQLCSDIFPNYKDPSVQSALKQMLLHKNSFFRQFAKWVLQKIK